ncbi:hypothetical protein [Salana multivorans]
MVLDGARVGADARLHRCIVDDSAQVAPGARVGAEHVISLIDTDGQVTDTAPWP